MRLQLLEYLLLCRQKRLGAPGERRESRATAALRADDALTAHAHAPQLSRTAVHAPGAPRGQNDLDDRSLILAQGVGGLAVLMKVVAARARAVALPIPPFIFPAASFPGGLQFLQLLPEDRAQLRGDDAANLIAQLMAEFAIPVTIATGAAGVVPATASVSNPPDDHAFIMARRKLSQPR